MTAEELAKLLKNPATAPALLDVREDDEREVARIEPSIHIPMGSIAARVEELPKNGTLVVYCHMGGRSEMVAAFLENRGFDGVVNLAGGIDAWSRRVDPSVPRY